MLDNLWMAGQIALFSTVPQAFACLFFVLVFWDFQVSKPWLKITKYAVFSSLAFVTLLMLPEVIRPLSLLIYTGIIMVLFRELSIRNRILITGTLIVLFVIVETTAAQVLIATGFVKMEDLAS